MQDNFCRFCWTIFENKPLQTFLQLERRRRLYSVSYREFTKKIPYFIIISVDSAVSTQAKQGRSSSIGAKILSFVSRKIMDDFKEEKESVQYRKPISYSHNLSFDYLLCKGSKSGKPIKTFLDAWPICHVKLKKNIV